jgi:hypothetical protein
MNARPTALAAAIVLATVPLAFAQVSQSRYLYTAPDPTASGGLSGTIVRPVMPVVAVLAMPPDDPAKVYKATLCGTRSNTFAFTGLPVAKYDLLVVFSEAFCEGLTLSREDNTLAAKDAKSIQTIIEKSEPFFNKKIIHRLAGTLGQMEGKARCICTFLRTRGALGFIDGLNYPEHRRAFKLVLLEDVGPAWQIVRTREIYVTQVPLGSGLDTLPHMFCPKLSSVRVTDAVKDLGNLDLQSK